jgi:predicted KAP-like P-loop ATPase
MDSDLPITTPDEDFFNYHPYAAVIAEQLLAGPDESFIAGVEAAWGSGKTSFLNLTRAAIRDKAGDNAVILEYCPWIYSTIDALLLGFCEQLASQLGRKVRDGKSLEKVSNALSTLSKVISLPRLIPIAAIPAEMVTTVLTSSSEALGSAARLAERDIFKAKEEVQTSIDESDKSIFVVIDDVDRLAPAEIRLLFQFLKAVADFRSVTYLLAYDPRPVTQALSFDGTLDGEEYLKKFIQLPIRLPRLSTLHLNSYLRNSLTKLAHEEQSHLTDESLTALQSEAQSIIQHPLFKTPRDITRAAESVPASTARFWR